MHQVIGFELDDHSASSSSSSLMVNGDPYNPYNWRQYGKRAPIPSALQSLLLINPPPLHAPPSAPPQTVQREEAIAEEEEEEEKEAAIAEEAEEEEATIEEEEEEAAIEEEEEEEEGKWISAVLPCSPPHNPIPHNLHIVSTDDGFTHLAIEEDLKKKLQYCHCPHLNTTRFHHISSSSFPSLNDEYNDDMEEKEEFSNDDDDDDDDDGEEEEEEEEEFSMKSPLFDEGNAGCYNHWQWSSIASKNNIDILQLCYLCKSFLCHSQDIFMYRGDRAFCSAECRQQHIAVDEISKPNTPIMLQKGLIFHPMKRRATTAAAA